MKPFLFQIEILSALGSVASFVTVVDLHGCDVPGDEIISSSNSLGHFCMV